MRLQCFEFFFVLGLHDDFGLAGAFPLFEDGVEGGGEGGGEGAVAGEGCVGGLRGDFAWVMLLERTWYSGGGGGFGRGG